MRLGVHLSIKDGFSGVLEKAAELNCDGFQIFAGNPRGWARKPLDPNDINTFREKQNLCQFAPIVIHLSYLPNPASIDQELYEKSVITLVEDYQRANLLGADYFVFHPGKAKDTTKETALERVAAAVNFTLSKVTGPTVLLFENQAGSGNEIAASMREMADLKQRVNPEYQQRIGMCFDTCHAFAAGYDLRGKDGWEQLIAEIDHYLGINFLKLFHLNDCLGKLGSHLDRHQHIGEGEIGLEGFKYLMNHPVLKEIPGILETPQKDPGDDLKNLATLRNLAN
ncbi:MAG TPA: deoxyribonuclease IV [Bacillota bacterium]|nr:deoxyribonuclease IV [Bacillota bacterium]HOL09216.1 deoxyribonuclease IV [Bacillota bacterium]HPO97040.1 deoxyribonuclease IV [Bacillota bacterium]